MKIPSLLLIGILALATAASAKTKVACVGNSITYGYGIVTWPDTTTYPHHLQELLGSADTVANFGVSSMTFLKAGGASYWTSWQFPNAIAYLADKVIIELGTNDAKFFTAGSSISADSLLKDYEALIDTFATLSSAPEIWTTLAQYANNSNWGIYDTTITEHINPVIAQAAIDKGVNVIDLHSVFTDRSHLLTDDTVHPDTAGARILAETVYKYMTWTAPTFSQNGNKLTASAGYGYQWYKDGAAVDGATSQSLTITAAGTYKVSVKVESNTDSRRVSAAVAVTDLNSAYIPGTAASFSRAAIQGNTLRITLSKATAVSATFFDMQGRTLRTFRLQGIRGANSFTLPERKSQSILRINVSGKTQTLSVPANR